MRNIRAVIVHGYTGRPKRSWLPWLKEQLQVRGVETKVPGMPTPDTPKLKSWLTALKKAVGEPDDGLVLVGHSLGAPTILRYLESLPPGTKVAGVVLVAGFAEPIHLSQLDEFTSGKWNDAVITANSGRIIAINSDNDHHVPLEMAEHIRDRFGADIFILHDAGHINDKSGYTELPEALWAVLTLLGSPEAKSFTIKLREDDTAGTE